MMLDIILFVTVDLIHHKIMEQAMINKESRPWVWLTFLIALFIIISCSFLTGGISEPPPTPTPTVLSLFQIDENSCEGLSGNLELQVLIGPSDAVGLEPFAVGNIPFTVQGEEGVYTLQGGGDLDYEDVLVSDWGTYTVEFDMDTFLTGSCDPDEEDGILKIKLEASGSQMVEVRAEGFQADYPWTGTHEFDLTFPLINGAKDEGEGWALILHLDE
jgi:hypothetical protein